MISEEEISNMSDNIVLLGFSRGAAMTRTVRIIKTRGSGHDNRECTLEISSRGVSIKAES
jgi:KaiC/GvpD/RAD55 family RecA-like ATPase